ncbi:Adenylyl-sulfate kinase [Methylacidimicrobium sp. AP8]|uniref:adenylyl-sulfate kinase n=1 Tax=Methylacidimicrobium sp. AP8 TaxID=2730359 RepID=UPI0018C0C874|nr:adenylyl-sulfate kinase [Methylacidimicrobium sp. AP8]CAB4244260.1 Adenylyl-sulfate kinase [Methylacidimicrobium sp. AP8]
MHFSEEVLPIVVIGHVDHGKSTLIGRLLFDTGSVSEGKAEELARAAAAEGVPFEYAFLLDSLLEEQAQNITIDTTEIRFRTQKRRYAIIDAPGHKEFLKNMLSGAARAQAAILVVDAREGVREQTRRHAMLLPILGIRHILVAVNKMDLVDFSEGRYREIAAALSSLFAELGLPEPTSLPLSAKQGENVVAPSARMPWHPGPALLEALDAVPSPSLETLPLRFVVQDVYRRGEERLIAGRVETGRLRVGEELFFWPGRKRARLRAFAEWPPESTPQEASAGRSTALILDEEIFVERGMIASSREKPPIEATEFPAKIFWIGTDPLRIGEPYELRLATQSAGARVTEVDRVLDAETLCVQDSAKPGVEANEIAEVLVRTQRPLALDNASEIPQTGRFILARDGRILGGGIVLGARYPKTSLPPAHRSSPLFWTEGEIDRNERARTLGHRGAVLWLTGLSGAGKSTLAVRLERALFRRGIWAYVLDGDNLRHGLSSDLGFSAEDRRENIRRAAEAARLLADAGAVAIVALISPFRADRRKAREIAEAAGLPFREVFVHAPLEVCRSRDPKSLYARAERGEIPEFTGLDSPYEVPEAPDLELPTHQLSPAECVERLAKLALEAIALPNRPSLREDPAANI